MPKFSWEAYKPKYLKLVGKPENASEEEISEALPVYIDGLETGGGDVSVTWEDVQGKPSTFTPSTHTHTVAQVTDLQGIIDDLTARLEALETASEGA